MESIDNQATPEGRSQSRDDADLTVTDSPQENSESTVAGAPAGEDNYPKNGEIHVRLGREAWCQLQQVCASRGASTREALEYALHFWATYPVDMQQLVDQVRQSHQEFGVLRELLDDSYRLEEELIGLVERDQP